MCNGLLQFFYNLSHTFRPPSKGVTCKDCVAKDFIVIKHHKKVRGLEIKMTLFKGNPCLPVFIRISKTVNL